MTRRNRYQHVETIGIVLRLIAQDLNKNMSVRAEQEIVDQAEERIRELIAAEQIQDQSMQDLGDAYE